MTPYIYLVEFTALVDQFGASQTFRFSSASAFMTLPSENPPNAAYPPFLAAPGQYERYAWSKGATRGPSSRGFGIIKFVNDGTFDSLLNYGLDGQPVVIRYGPDGGGYPSAFLTLFTGVIRRGQFPSRTEFDLVLVDRQGDAADFTYQTIKFLGTNSGATGLEGLATDIQGKPKPKLRGRASNVPAICVNSSSLVYQVDDGSAIVPASNVFLAAVYDKRSVLTAGTVYGAGSLATFLAAVPLAGHYNSYCGSEGWYFMLGSSPSGIVTCDCFEGAASNRTVAQIVSRVASSEGQLPLSQMTGIAALDGAKPYECGKWVGVETTVGQVIDEVLDSANAYMTDSRAGNIQFGYLQDPANMQPVATIQDWMVKNEAGGYVVTGTNDPGVGLRLSSNFDGTAQRYASNQDSTLGLPCWRVLCLYGFNNQVMTSTDLAGDALSDIGYARLAYRTTTAADATVLLQHRKAPEFTVTTLVCSATDAATEAAAQLALRKAPRNIYAIPLDPGMLDNAGSPITAAIDLGTCFTLVSDRFGMSAGKNLLCIGISETFGDPSTAAMTTIYAWG